jgi:hypothetical protein
MWLETIMDKKKNKRSGKWIGPLLIAVAIANELRKSPEERTWHDRLFGVLPYDLRFPTWTRLKQTFWNPTSERILVPKAFGVGWSLNVGGLLHRAGLVDG